MSAAACPKVIRCRQFAKPPIDDSGTKKAVAVVNDRYHTNNPKEELLLEHVRQFEKTFLQVYGERFLFLCPPNEFEKPKFLPTTLRPTHLAYRELYDFESCALFLADFMNYEPLMQPNRYPHVIPSPSSVLEWRQGDCFDFSMVLCSLLLGVGYDAYCVSGFAPRYITCRNENRQPCPKIGEKRAEASNTREEDGENAFTIEKKPALKSQFIEKQARLKKEREQDELEEAQRSDSDDNPDSDDDEYENERIHCWVLVRKGSREVAEDVYVEPTTGRVYSTTECPYLRADLIWNHKNLWVNMQQIPANNLSLELMDPKYFEYVIRDPDASARGAAGHLEENTEEKREQGELLDIPSSWCERLDISRDRFSQQCYQGEKTVLYEKCKVEKYAINSQVDGLVERITVFKDLRRQVPLGTRERFMWRKDKLEERIRRPMQNELVELFRPGRADNLKEFRDTAGVRQDLHYYHKSRADGLVCFIDDIGHKISETYFDRDDRLIYHSVTIDEEGTNGKHMLTLNHGLGDKPIRKMVRKYEPPEEGEEAAHPWAKIVFFMREREKRVRIDYHCEPGKVDAHSLILWQTDNTKLECEHTSNPDCPIPTGAQTNKLIQMQKDCLLSTKPSFTEALNNTHTLLVARAKEEKNIRDWRTIEPSKGDKDKKDSKDGTMRRDENVIEESVYYRARIRAMNEQHTRAGVEEEKAEEAATKVDILGPYLMDFQNKPLDAMAAEFVAKKCKNDFRKRLLDRAGIIQHRLEQEQDDLRKRKSQMARRGDNFEKDERQFEAYQADAMFRIQILEQRLARHEISAIKKFSDLERTLSEDLRLSAMWNKAPPGK